MRQVAIIGAGVAGLTVAFRLARLGERVSVFEASERLGGQLHSEQSGGFLIEHGAEGFVAGSEALAELAGALGIASELRGQLVLDSCHYDGQQLTRLERFNDGADQLRAIHHDHKSSRRGPFSSRKTAWPRESFARERQMAAPLP